MENCLQSQFEPLEEGIANHNRKIGNLDGQMTHISYRLIAKCIQKIFATYVE